MEYFYSSAHLPYFLAAMVAGIGIWFFQRKDRQKIYLPLLKVLDLPDRQIRRWTVVWPPLVPLLVSLGLMAILLFASLGPYRLGSVLSRSPAQKILMVVDLSPSLQAATTISRYRDFLKTRYRKLKQKTSVIWLDSAKMQPMAFIDDSDMEQYVDQLAFHPWGVNLDNLLAHAQNYSDYSILLFSDRDQNAWQNFAQQFGTDRSVWWQDMSPGRTGDNIYVDAITLKDDPDPAYINLEYRLSRSSGLDTKQVQLKVVPADDQEGEMAMSQAVTFASNRRSLTSSIALARSDWAANENALLVLKIETPNSVALDDTTYFSVGAGEKKALLVTHQGGEKFIDSPVFSTVQSLKSLGYDVDLAYSWPQRAAKTTDPLPYQLVVVVGFTDRFFRTLCDQNPRDNLAANTPLWVVDLSLNRQEHLASSRCRYLFPKVASRGNDHVLSPLRRNGYSEMTPELAVPTFMQKRRASDTRLVIIRNLTELHEVNYRLNVMFYYDLLQRSRLAQRKGPVTGSEHVMAITDGSSRSLAELQSFPRQNVPVIESRLQTINEELLPPRFSLAQISESGVKQKKLIPDSTAVFRLLMIGVIILSIVEATYRWQRNRIGHFMVWFGLGIGTAVTLFPTTGAAEVSMGLYRLPYGVDQARFQTLAKYVKTRTSLQLPAKPYVSETFDAKLLSRPMIVAGSGSLNQLTAEQKRQLSRWLLAGGILIADKMTDRGPLVNLTNELVINGNWQDVSLDNELMRSFHLLPSLPLCGGIPFSEFRLENRIAILTVPFSLGSVLLAQEPDSGCPQGTAAVAEEFYPKLFINILMTALTTDYKKDQIHLPEILKKLR